MATTEYAIVLVTLVCSGEEVHCVMEEGIDGGKSGRMRLITEKEGELPFREGDTIGLKLSTKDASFDGGEITIDRLYTETDWDLTRFTIQFHREW